MIVFCNFVGDTQEISSAIKQYLLHCNAQRYIQLGKRYGPNHIPYRVIHCIISRLNNSLAQLVSRENSLQRVRSGGSELLSGAHELVSRYYDLTYFACPFAGSVRITRGGSGTSQMGGGAKARSTIPAGGAGGTICS